ncbi:acetyltransferase [Desulfospira joergensenii]|uniref:acetyltransferase n=1 Tax=Desulfospira joergensenii TaxID=53329 RepID=UPI0003B553EF|nr:acetyltransferase [Desulfospira joergensenii]
MSKDKIILIGGGGHCHSCIDVIEAQGDYEIAGVIERTKKQKVDPTLGYPIVGYDEDLSNLRKQIDYALITVGQVGSGSKRQKLFDRLKKMNFVLPVIISPSAHVSRHAVIGEGTIVMHQVIVNAGASIGKNCILNTKCLIEHDTMVGHHTHISTAAVINGGGEIGSCCFVGSNATIIQGVRISDNQFLKAGRLYSE